MSRNHHGNGDSPDGSGVASHLAVDGSRARFVLTHSLPCTPEQLWPWLTEPARLAQWSSAAVEMQGAFAPGTERLVRLRLGPIEVFTLRETITQVEVGRMFAYCGQSVREHAGTALLTSSAEGTRLTWTASFQAPIALLARPMAELICRQMRASFAELSRILHSAHSKAAAQLAR